MKYFPLITIILSVGLAGFSLYLKSDGGLQFAGAIAGIAGTSYQRETSKAPSVEKQNNDIS
jgi:hypothetical protein